MKEIELTQGKVALVDDADYDYLMQWSWFAHRQGKSGRWYAARTSRTGKQTTLGMHRQLINGNIAGTLKADHKNGNGLDNQRHNLRPATKSQNGANRKLNTSNTSGFKGVSWSPREGKFRTRFQVKDKDIHVGYYRRAIDAAVAYDEAAECYFGDFARLNFSRDPACFI